MNQNMLYVQISMLAAQLALQVAQFNNTCPCYV